MRIGWIGFHLEGMLALQALLQQGIPVVAVITLTVEKAEKRSAAIDYATLCHRFGVPLYRVANINDPESVRLLNDLALDLVFVIGWSQILGSEVLRSARLGMIGAHASLLPHNRGSAPINWALIKGERETGNSLIWLTEYVDEGFIIDQTAIPITPYDTCASLYEKVAESNRDMILRVIPELLAGKRPGRPQPPTQEPVLPRRRPTDGLLDWSKSSTSVYNFIRALARPYPGAFSWLGGKCWRIWQAALIPGEGIFGKPGQVLGSVYSPVEFSCGQAVACGNGMILILEAQADGEEPLLGRRLSEQQWKGMYWSNEQGTGDSSASG